MKHVHLEVVPDKKKEKIMEAYHCKFQWYEVTYDNEAEGTTYALPSTYGVIYVRGDDMTYSSREWFNSNYTVVKAMKQDFELKLFE